MSTWKMTVSSGITKESTTQSRQSAKKSSKHRASKNERREFERVQLHCL